MPLLSAGMHTSRVFSSLQAGPLSAPPRPSYSTGRGCNAARTRGLQARSPAGRRGSSVCVGAQSATGPGSHASADEDLLQHPERLKWYETKFCADDMPDWNAARFLRSEDVAPGMRNVVLEIEISRERVPLRNAHKVAGQRASVRVVGSFNRELTVASAPHPLSLNRHPLFLVRGDLFAYEIKKEREPAIIKAEVHLLVGEREAPEIFNLEEDDLVEVGPFVGGGLDLKGSGVLAIYRYPTVVMFVTGRGIAAARSLLESSSDVPNMSTRLRNDIRIYYLVQNDASVIYREHFDAWAAAAADGGLESSGCRLAVHTTSHSFQDAFDGDMTLAYDPAATAAIILTGGDEEAEAAARAVCAEAEITTILSDAVEAAPLAHLDSTPRSFSRWAKEHAN